MPCTVVALTLRSSDSVMASDSNGQMLRLYQSGCFLLIVSLNVLAFQLVGAVTIICSASENIPFLHASV